MRRTIPSEPGAVETWMRSPSVFCNSVASVRSMAEAPSRTFTASTAREGCAASSKPASASMTAVALRSEINPEPPTAAMPVMLLIRPRQR